MNLAARVLLAVVFNAQIANPRVDLFAGTKSRQGPEVRLKRVGLLPGWAKFVVVKKPATKARKGTNPFTGEEMMFKAKPARKIVRARPVKAAKDAV